MNGWYVVYLLICAINGALCTSQGYHPGTWQFWVWVIMILFARLSGLYGR